MRDQMIDLCKKRKKLMSKYLLLQLSHFLPNKAGASNRCFSDAAALSGHQTTARSERSLERDRL